MAASLELCFARIRCKKSMQYLGWIRRQQLPRSCVLKGTNFNLLMKGKLQVMGNPLKTIGQIENFLQIGVIKQTLGTTTWHFGVDSPLPKSPNLSCNTSAGHGNQGHSTKTWGQNTGNWKLEDIRYGTSLKVSLLETLVDSMIHIRYLNTVVHMFYLNELFVRNKTKSHPETN